MKFSIPHKVLFLGIAFSLAACGSENPEDACDVNGYSWDTSMDKYSCKEVPAENRPDVILRMYYAEKDCKGQRYLNYTGVMKEYMQSPDGQIVKADQSFKQTQEWKDAGKFPEFTVQSEHREGECRSFEAFTLSGYKMTAVTP